MRTWLIAAALLCPAGCGEDEVETSNTGNETNAGMPTSATTPAEMTTSASTTDDDTSDPGTTGDAPDPSEPGAATPRTFAVLNGGEVPLLIDSYPGFRISSNDASFSRWTCAPECGVCDFGECGCAPDAVAEVMPGETLELSWAGEYWEEHPDECDGGCAIRRSAPEAAYTLTLDYGTEAFDDGGCRGTHLTGDVATVTVDFEHPAETIVEVTLPPV